MQEPPIIVRYPAFRLLLGLGGSALFGYVGFLALMGDHAQNWLGWIPMTLGIAGALHFGGALVLRDRLGALRIGTDGLVFRLGFRARRADFLGCGPFHSVDYIGAGFVTWRKLATERSLPPVHAGRAPDPSDEGTGYLELPSAMIASLGGSEALADLLNRRRRAARQRAGVPEEIDAIQASAGLADPVQHGGFLSPPAIPRAVFIALYMYANPVAVFCLIMFHDEIGAAAEAFAAARLGAGTPVAPIARMIVIAACFLVLVLWNTWLTAGRLKDLMEEAGFWRAFHHAFLSGSIKRRKLIFRKGEKA